MDITKLPLLNACLNFSAFLALLTGWIFIKQGNKRAHKNCMVAALIVSTLFLISYLTYHAHHGTTHYTKQGMIRVIYFFILTTHTPLAALIIPFAVTAVTHAIRGNFDKHTKITRWLLPVWLYVSVTGVIIYLMLYVF